MKRKLSCILLIDDDEPTNYFSNLIIEEANCTAHVEMAENGIDALNFLSKSELNKEASETCPRPDIIFLDINMPAMNGWEFLEKFRALPAKKREGIIIIMLTTSDNPDDQAKSLEMESVSGFETKPLTEIKLANILTTYFPDYF